MITVNLKLRYSPQPLRTTQGWYIAGSDPAAWLEEVTRWEVAQAELRLWPLPRSATDRAPCGVLVTLREGSVPAHVSRCCISFGEVAGQLYLPVEAWLDPDLSDAELQANLVPGKLYVWHPTVGLVAFEPDDAIELSQLISIPAPRVRRWDGARPGIALAPRLTALMPEQNPSLEMILEQGQSDIGTESDQLSGLPPSDLEPKPGMLHDAGRKGMRMIAGMIRWLAQHAPMTSNQPTWINKLEDWATEKLSNFYAGLDAERNKELLRLMEMLESDPDRGLRFALPLHGDAHRGIAPPGGRLVERPTNFNLNQMGGGRAADFWDLSSDYRQRLTARYRELANRELSLGRHRRAAYIYAELLGDYHAAAGALTDGHYWREAAILYRIRLNRPQDAASCLEAGGLWSEAIELYVELEEFEKAGDLYLRLDQTNEAEVQFHRAVSKLHAQGDLLNSARLLEKKLNSIDEALEELTSGWPNAAQAGQCLRESFQLLGRLGRHKESQLRIEQFREDPLPVRNPIALVDIIADTALQYPDRNVQMAAADCTRVLVSRQLNNANKSDAGHLLSAITRLVPADRLLNRDCQRYLQHQPAPVRSQRPAKPMVRGKTPRLVRKLQLPHKLVQWQAAVSTGNMIVVAGRHKHQFVVARSNWLEIDPQSKIWGRPVPDPEEPILMAAAPQWQDFVLVHPLGRPSLPFEHEFKPTDVCPFSTKVGAIRGMSPQILAASGTSHGVIWLLELRDYELTAIAIGANGQQISTETIELPTVSPDFTDVKMTFPIPFHARSDTRYFGWYNCLLVHEKAKPPKTIEFAQQISSLAGSAPFTLTRIAVTFPRGGTVLWDDFEGEHVEPFGEDLVNPIVCVNRQGYLIAVSDAVGEIYYTHGRKVHFESQFTISGAKPIAVLPPSQSNQFGIVSESGEISVYEID